MLKGEDGKWVKELPISIEIWVRIIEETRNGIYALLTSAEKLLANDGDMRVCAGLYTFALEEYGKLLLLKSYAPCDGTVIIKYRDEFRNHKTKFDIALKNLPNECTILHKGAFQPDTFQQNAFDTDQVADLEARLAILYSDFTPDANGIVGLPVVDRDLLVKAIFELKNKALEQSIP